MRKFPATMGTQHPDNANYPYWDKDKDSFVPTYKETEEALSNFSDLGIEEYMWDWEGKNADASVVDKLLSKYYAYFNENKLGKDVFLTFRVPNIWEEKGYSLLQAMTVMLSSEDFARDLNYNQRPLFEVILPMTVNSDQLMHLHKLFNNFSNFKSTEFTSNRKQNTKDLEVIPLVEDAKGQREISKLLAEYIAKHQKSYGKKPEYLRPFIACSDPALTEGFITTKLSNKLALIEIEKVAQTTKVPMYPIAGPGSLPFRGGLTPDSVNEFSKDYAGLKTVTLQSAFRYDYPIKQVKDAVKYLNNNLQKHNAELISDSEIKTLNKVADSASKIYKQSLKHIAPLMSEVFTSVPKKRERRQHVGLLAYSRSSAGQSLPRAITFTAGFYSIGVPPEFIGTGRALAKLSKNELDLVLNFSKTLRPDLMRAGNFLNKSNLRKLSATNSAWEEIEKDIQNLENILHIEFGPETDEQKKHLTTSSKALNNINNQKKLTSLIEKSAKLRLSLG